jgi:hypothetical protein
MKLDSLVVIAADTAFISALKVDNHRLEQTAIINFTPGPQG